MFLQNDDDVAFSVTSFRVIGYVLKNPDLEDFAENWDELIHEDIQDYFSEKIAWCWARMISQALNSSWHPDRPKLKRKGDVCVYCGKVASCSDHIWPFALGGPAERDHNSEWNFNDSCKLCNRIKGLAPLVCPPLPKFIQYCQYLYDAEYEYNAQNG